MERVNAQKSLILKETDTKGALRWFQGKKGVFSINFINEALSKLEL